MGIRPYAQLFDVVYYIDNHDIRQVLFHDFSRFLSIRSRVSR